MLSMRELRRVAKILDERFAGHRVEKVIEPREHRVELTLYGHDAMDERSEKRHLVLCCAPRFGRVSERATTHQAPKVPPRFAQYLRPRLGGARLRHAGIEGEDRQLSLLFEGAAGRFELLLALMGNRSNLYLLDAERRVCAAQRPLEQTRRTLSLGAPFEDPPPPRGDWQEGEDRWEPATDLRYLREIENLYKAAEDESVAEQRGQKVARALRREWKLAARRLSRIESELAEASDANRLQRDGELLKVSLSEVVPGTSELRVRDFETGEPATITLDPSRTPQENLKDIFKRYQKLVRRLAKAGAQVEAARARKAELEALQAELEAAIAQGEATEGFFRREVIQTLLRRHAPARAPQVDAPARPKLPAALRGVPRSLLPRRYTSLDGLDIWVGRSDEGNDYLSTRLARGNDLFFHLDGAPGSHVVLRTEGRPDPPSDSLLDAAELAVHFSKAKNATRADVHIVPMKQVKKPKGAKKGLVYVTGGRSLHLRREPARLKRVLDSQIEG